MSNTDFYLEPTKPVEEFYLSPVESGSSPMDTYIPRVSMTGTDTKPNPVPKNLTRDQILNSPEYMGIIRNSMKTRFGVDQSFGDNARAALKGYDSSYRDDMEDEELLEMWQNYMRHFSGGHTVTTAAEVAFHQNASEEDKATVGQSYLLFDQMPNIFSEDTEWGEMFDGMWDYTRAAIYDPATLLGVGAGKAVGAVGTKATAEGIKRAAMGAAKASLSKGATKEVAKQAGKTAAKLAFTKQAAINTGKLAAIDLPFALGADLAYQYSMLEGDAQEEWSKVQTGVSALGAMVLPATVAGFHGVRAVGSMKGADKVGIQNYTRITEKLAGQTNPKAVMKAVQGQIDRDILQSELGILFGDIDKLLKNPGVWKEGVRDGADVADEFLGGTIDISDKQSQFFRTLLLGDAEAGVKGLVSTLKDAGVVYVERGKGDKVSNFLGDVISELPKAQAAQITSFLRKVAQENEGLLPADRFAKMSTEELGSYYKKMMSNAGQVLGQAGLSAQRLKSKKPATVKKATQGLAAAIGDKPTTRRINYLQNSYKRVLTSHLSTTFLNVKGWAWKTTADSLADIVEGTLLAASTPVAMVAGRNPTQQLTKAKGSILGGMRRGWNVLNHIDTLEAAKDYLDVRPEVRQRLHQYIAGGVSQPDEVDSLLKQYGLDTNSKLNRTTEKVISFGQAATGVKLQDEVTKQLSFLSALDQEIMKKYGHGFNKFMEQPDAYVKMFSEDYLKVEQKALERAVREAYSKPFSADRNGGMATEIAKAVETASNTPGIGVLFPFGQFLNNSLATLGDYSGANWIKHMAARSIGKEIDTTKEEGLNLFAKAIVGWSAAAFYYKPLGEKKLEEGLRWNQERQEDGSIKDLTYDFPAAPFHMVGQILGHIERDGEIPPELQQEAFNLVLGQATRDLGEAAGEFDSVVMGLIEAIAEGDLEHTKDLAGYVGAFAARMTSGFTRPLDHVNQLAAVFTDSFENLDRRQGIEAWNNSVRYVDQVFDGISTTEEIRFKPFNRQAPQDVGKLLGERKMQPPSPSERILASIGKSPWFATGWQGDNPQMKNTLDRMLEPIVNSYSQFMLDENPDYFSMPLNKREMLWQSKVIEPARKEAKEQMRTSSRVDPVLTRLQAIYDGHSTRDIERALGVLTDGMSLADVAESPNGVKSLEVILDYLDNQGWDLE